MANAQKDDHEHGGGNSGPGGGNDHGGGKPKTRIFIDEKEYPVDAKNLSGAQIKTLAKPPIPSEYQLFLEQPGEDQQVHDTTTVKIINDMKFYSLPPATFG